jgi:hypothetical protein
MHEPVRVLVNHRSPENYGRQSVSLLGTTSHKNKAIMGPSTQEFFSSSDVIATRFGHTTIIKGAYISYCLKPFA